ncbi:MAG: hypothetical protein ACLQHF_16175 [Terracidiphilus sp.]
MNPRLAHFLVKLYPRSWRERYGEEFEELLVSAHGMPHDPLNVVLSALRERVIAGFGRPADLSTVSFGAIVRLPGALIPMAMSLSALAIVAIHIAMHGAAREVDEVIASSTPRNSTSKSCTRRTGRRSSATSCAI